MQNIPQIIIFDNLQLQNLIEKIDAIYLMLYSPDKDKELEDLLSTKEAAKKLKVCPKTIINLIEGGKLNAIKFNKGEGKRGHYKITKNDLNKFLKVKRLGY